jgi:F0F1-type ATP synthase membrane subunit b/b'
MIILAFAENSIQLVPDGTILFHLFLVIVMVALLNRTLFGPINKVLADREAQTSGRTAQARQLQGKVETNLAQYERDLRAARASAYGMIESERAKALQSRETALSKVRDEIRSEVRREKTEIERQAVEARETLRAQAIESALVIGSQILRRPVRDANISDR